jgi:hypothetical protein
VLGPFFVARNTRAVQTKIAPLYPPWERQTARHRPWPYPAVSDSFGPYVTLQMRLWASQSLLGSTPSRMWVWGPVGCDMFLLCRRARTFMTHAGDSDRCRGGN